MSVFDRPSAANRIAFARTTSRYGPEYAAARRSSSRRCSSLKTTRCGEVCAIAHQNSPAPSQSLQPFAAYFRRRPLRNSSSEPVRLVNIHRPALRFERLFRELNALISSGKIKRLPPTDLRSLILTAVLFARYPDEQRVPGPQGVLFKTLALLGTALGIRVDR